MSRALGSNQVQALRCLAEFNNGTWYPGAGWEWGNTSTTVRLLDSLVKRGLATKRMKESRLTAEKYPFYEITEAGKEANS